jgi:hypothetical protein
MEKRPTVESFLEKNNMDYLFLLLCNLEANRLNSLPFSIKKSFPKKITEIAMENVAKNQIPDFIIEQEEEIDMDEE